MPKVHRKRTTRKRTHKKSFHRKHTSLTKHFHTVTLNKMGLLYPDRLRVKVKADIGSQVAFAGAAYANQDVNASSPLSVFGTENCSGLRWLLGSIKTDGTAVAPYAHGVVVSCMLTIFAQTSVAPATNQTPVIIVYPQGALNQSTDTLTWKAALEQPKCRSAYLSFAPGAIPERKPLIKYKFYPYQQAGQPWSVFRSANENWFTYTSAPADSWFITTKYAMSQGAVDANCNLNTQNCVEYILELFDRQQAPTSAPA